WVRNLLTLVAAAAFVIIATTALYHRAWELLAPIEPPHGPSRLSQSECTIARDDYNSMTISLGDGRVWSGRFISPMDNSPASWRENGQMKPIPDSAGFIVGTNWARVVNGLWETVGIQRDG